MMRSNDAECPICLDGMNEADVAYPLLCPLSCGYNFCLSCVEHLLESSKDDYQMASDGNRHVKVQLFCPQCRGNLAGTILDTIILRKAKNAEKFRDVGDSELNASELRQKHEFSTVYAKDVADAQARLRAFLKNKGRIDTMPVPLEPSESHSHGDEEEKPFIDTTMFQGLENFMSSEERIYVQKLLISGVPDSLVSAAQILNGILQLTMQGMAPKHTQEKSRADERKHLDTIELFRKRYPLPARMPKYYVINTFPSNKALMTFQDEEWDGSIADAFSRVQVSKPKPNPGMENILREADRLYLQPRARVKLTSVKGQAGKVGLQKGDIVTHVNGETFDGTAEELKNLVASSYAEDPESTFQIVVNADECTAEVLKVRYRKATKSVADIANL